MSMSREKCEHEAFTLFHEVHKATHESILSTLMEIDLSFAQLRAFFVISKEGPMVVGQIARYLGIGISTAGHLVDRLVRLELVQRQEDTQDRRRILVSLSSQGEGYLDRLHGNSQYIRSYLHVLTDDELSAFIYGIQALERGVRRTQFDQLSKGFPSSSPFA